MASASFLFILQKSSFDRSSLFAYHLSKHWERYRNLQMQLRHYATEITIPQNEYVTYKKFFCFGKHVLHSDLSNVRINGACALLARVTHTK